MSLPIEIYRLGMQDYQSTWDAMQTFTKTRNPDSTDRLYLVQHPPVFTQGQAGKAEHILNPGTIPVIQSDRGGQVTYHGPGQLVLYVMLDLKRANFTIRQLVSSLEQSVVAVLADLKIAADTRCDAPGVYVDGAKIASIGLRVKRGCSYHGLAFNVDMDLEPFSRINPCGFKQLTMTKVSDHVSVNLQKVENLLLSKVTQTLNCVSIDIFSKKVS